MDKFLSASQITEFNTDSTHEAHYSDCTTCFRHMKYRILKVLEVVMVAFTTTAIGFCAMYFVEDCTYAQVKDNTTELYNLQVLSNSFLIGQELVTWCDISDRHLATT